MADGRGMIADTNIGYFVTANPNLNPQGYSDDLWDVVVCDGNKVIAHDTIEGWSAADNAGILALNAVRRVLQDRNLLPY
jgi:hypothetical protein